VEWDIEKYREWMGCGVELDRERKPRINKKTGKPKYIKYQKHTDAITATTREPLKEFKGTELEFTVSAVYGQRASRGRPKIEKLRFDFTWPRKSNKEKILSWIEKSQDFRNIYERLREYKVTDAVIVKYSRIIGKKKLNQLLYEWDLRQEPRSRNKIENPEKYCNKVLKDVATSIEPGQNLKT